MVVSSGSRVRITLVGVAVTLLLLSGCGRKGMLEAPPSAQSAAVPPQAQPGLGEPEHSGIEGDRVVQQQAPSTPRRDSFFLDWLLK